MTLAPPTSLTELRSVYAQRRPISRRLHDRAREVLPGGNTRTQVHFDPFPFYVASADGCRLDDVDGLSYLDLVNNYTSLVHGHGHPDVERAIVQQVKRGTAYGAPTESEIELAEELTRRVPSLQSVRFTNSGTEAVLFAVKTARIATGRDSIVKLEGSYHGGAESVQMTVGSMGEPGDVVAEPGVPTRFAPATRVVALGDARSVVDGLRRVAADAAAVVVEPMLGGGTMVPVPIDVLRGVADVARELGALLIFDEVLTFRLGCAGLQGTLGITPDLTALGKIIGGGLPVGAFGGRRDLMEVWSPQAGSHRYAAGTFNANPVTMAAGLAGLRALTPAAVERINAIGERLREAFNNGAQKLEVPLVASGYGSIFQFHQGDSMPTSHRDAASRDRDLVRHLFHHLLERGVFLTPRGTGNISTAVTDEDLGAILAALDDSLVQVARSGPGRT